METLIIARHMDLYDGTKALIEKKLSKFDKYFKGEPKAFVTLKRVRESDRMEVTISCNDTPLLRAEKTCPTFHIALDECIESIERQIRKNKTRLQKKMREEIRIPADEFDADDFGEENDFKIRTKTFLLKPMTPDEAILQMNLLGHTFFVFKDELNGKTCVVYKREAGSYGMIVPED